MVQNVTIPLSWANNIIGVSGVQDVVFDIPQVSDIEDVVDRLTPDLDDIEAVVDDVTAGAEDIQEEFEQRFGDIPSGIELGQQVAQDLLDELEAQADRVETLIADPIVDKIVRRLSPGGTDIGDIVIDPEELADDLADRIDVPSPGTAQVRFEGVFGPLASDIKEGVTGALNTVLGDVDDFPDDLNSLTEAIEDVRSTVNDLDTRVDVPSVEDITEGVTEDLEALPGWTLITDPDQFIDDQIQRVTGGLVSDEAQEDLLDVVEDLQ